VAADRERYKIDAGEADPVDECRYTRPVLPYPSHVTAKYPDHSPSPIPSPPEITALKNYNHRIDSAAFVSMHLINLPVTDSKTLSKSSIPPSLDTIMSAPNEIAVAM
jgi:hypothetical protein